MKTEDNFHNINESTILDGEGNLEKNVNDEGMDLQSVAVEKGNTWKKVSIAGGVGILLGAATTYLAGTVAAKTPNDTEDINPEQEQEARDESNGNPLVDDGISLATTVNDDMTFDEAFATARGEVGSGGAFEWKGNLYSTYTVEEWDNMSQEEHSAYYNHFAWYSNDDNATHHVAHASSNAHSGNDVAQAQETAQPSENVHATSENEADNTQTEEQQDIAVIEEHEPEVEVLGAYHNPSTGMNAGGLVIDGQEILVLDVDGDGTFDIAASDINHNGGIEREEVIDISGSGLTVDDLLQNMDTDNDIYTGGEVSEDNDYFVEA